MELMLSGKSIDRRYCEIHFVKARLLSRKYLKINGLLVNARPIHRRYCKIYELIIYMRAMDWKSYKIYWFIAEDVGKYMIQW